VRLVIVAAKEKDGLLGKFGDSMLRGTTNTFQKRKGPENQARKAEE